MCSSIYIKLGSCIGKLCTGRHMYNLHLMPLVLQFNISLETYRRLFFLNEKRMVEIPAAQAWMSLICNMSQLLKSNFHHATRWRLLLNHFHPSSSSSSSWIEPPARCGWTVPLDNTIMEMAQVHSYLRGCWKGWFQPSQEAMQPETQSGPVQTRHTRISVDAQLPTDGWSTGSLFMSSCHRGENAVCT